MAQSAASAPSWRDPGLILGLLLLLGAAALLAVRIARELWAVRQRAARLSDLAEAVADLGLLLLDSTGCVTYSNGAAQRLHGYGEREIVGQHYALLFTMEDRRGRVPEDELEAAARESPFIARGSRMHREGRRIAMEARLTALRDGTGTLVGFSVVERDISGQLAHEQALAEARDTLAAVQKLAALGRLGEGIAHEFNNVVHVIRTSVALLQRRWAADEQASGFLQMITRNADRAAALSQHLLALARRQPLHPVATDVNEVVTTVVALLRQTLNESIVVEEQLEEPLSWVTADRSELEAALLHVAANARDVMPEGGRLTFRTAELLQPAADTGGPEAATASGPLRRSVLISIRETGSQAAPVVSTRMNDAALDSVRSLLEHSHGELKIERDDEGLRVDLYLAARPG